MLASILDSKPAAVVRLVHETKQTIKSRFERNFLVLPDGKTVIGPGRSMKNLIAEDITLNKSSRIATHKNEINTVIFDEASSSLFVGDDTGHVLQYKKDKESGTFTFLKDYGNLGIGYIISSSVLQDLVFFGGFETSKIRVISIKEGGLLGGFVETAFKTVYSIQTCRVSYSKTVISVGGNKGSYCSICSDVYRVKMNEAELSPCDASVESLSLVKKDYSSREIMDILLYGVRVYFETLLRENRCYTVNHEKGGV